MGKPIYLNAYYNLNKITDFIQNSKNIYLALFSVYPQYKSFIKIKINKIIFQCLYGKIHSSRK